MRLHVKRFQFRDRCTIGHLFIDGKDTGYFTLEDKDREQFGSPVDLWKVPGETAIPRGIYKIEFRLSLKFNINMPFLVGVPGFDGVMLHSGNTERDTEGCILVGEYWSGADFIGDSKKAFMDVRKSMQNAAKDGERVEIQVS